jgi:hypothetical protein
LFENIVETGLIKNLNYVIVKSPVQLPKTKEALNGYVQFPQRPLKEQDYNGILTYVPVHGGITFACEADDGTMWYGFDTLHYNSDKYPIDDINWIKDQIRIMAEAIIIASKVERAYLRAKTNEEKLKAIEKVQSVSQDQSVDNWNFGIMLNLLSGEL